MIKVIIILVHLVTSELEIPPKRLKESFGNDSVLTLIYLIYDLKLKACWSAVLSAHLDQIMFCSFET